jgi:hypothetical protein
MVKMVRTIHDDNQEQKRWAKASQWEASAMRQLLGEPSTLEEYTVHVRVRDDSLAAQVAIRVAARNVVDIPASQHRSWVTGKISTLDSPPSTLLSAIPEGIERAAQVLEDVRRLVSMSVMPHSTSTAESQDDLSTQDTAVLDSQDTAVLDSQDTAVLDSQDTAVLDSQVIVIPDSQHTGPTASRPEIASMPSRKRRVGDQRGLSAKHRMVMQERDANTSVDVETEADADAVLIFTPKTRAGRVRKPTSRGKENFQMEL